MPSRPNRIAVVQVPVLGKIPQHIIQKIFSDIFSDNRYIQIYSVITLAVKWGSQEQAPEANRLRL